MTTAQTRIDWKQIKNTPDTLEGYGIKEGGLNKDLSNLTNSVDQTALSILKGKIGFGYVTSRRLTSKVVTVPSGVATLVGSTMPADCSDRIVAEIKAVDSYFPVYIGFSSNASPSNSRKVTGAFVLAVSKEQKIYVYQNSGSPMNVSIVEGWK